jgi:hypothetical protein
VCFPVSVQSGWFDVPPISNPKVDRRWPVHCTNLYDVQVSLAKMRPGFYAAAAAAWLTIFLGPVFKVDPTLVEDSCCYYTCYPSQVVEAHTDVLCAPPSDGFPPTFRLVTNTHTRVVLERTDDNLKFAPHPEI